jgi:hypothetical protein
VRNKAFRRKPRIATYLQDVLDAAKRARLSDLSNFAPSDIEWSVKTNQHGNARCLNLLEAAIHPL